MKTYYLSTILHLVFLGILGSNLNAQVTRIPQLGKDPVSDLVKTMTLEEKASLVVGNGFYVPGSLMTASPGLAPKAEQLKVPGAAGTTCVIQKLGITSLSMSDGPSGVDVYDFGQKRVYYATSWPCPELTACSWDTTLAFEIGTAFGNEVREYGLDIILGPGLNIHRNPLCGRNYEYFSEDPVITGNMAAALINGIQTNGVGATVKHFAANNQEFNRSASNTIASERALREVYLKGWEIAVKKSQPWSVMTSYNLINGTYTAERNDLLQKILRNEFGFKGLVMTDWYGGNDPVAIMNAGNSLIMPGSPGQVKIIIESVKNGKLPENVLDQNVTDVLNTILKSPTFRRCKYSDKPDLYTHAKESRKAASESMVLLKNNAATLPFKSDIHTISLFGNNGYDLISHGRGGGQVNVAYRVSLAEGLARAGYTVERNIAYAYLDYLAAEGLKRQRPSLMLDMINPAPPIRPLALDSGLLKKTAAISDIALIAISRLAGEGKDRFIKDDYYLNEVEKQQIRKISQIFHALNKRVVVVLNISGAIDMTEWRDEVDAILLAWLPGLEGGNAMTDILTGKVNPSGKLASTFPMKYEDIPSAKNFPGKVMPGKPVAGFAGSQSQPTEVLYEEGIYVGYRYFSTFNVRPAYEFGYGLSYTTFQYDDLKISSGTFADKISASVSVTNTGTIPGKEVVELYITAPVKKLDKPALELKAFAKTGLLKPGESQTLTFTLTADDLASYNTKASSWIAEAGRYLIKFGASSLDIRQTGTFDVDRDIVAKKVQNALIPKVQLIELKPEK